MIIEVSGSLGICMQEVPSTYSSKVLLGL
jgi:hypothetical protein